MQTPGAMGLAPTLTATFQSPPKGVQKPPAVVTSSAAEDHVNNMATAAQTATQDAQNSAAYKLQSAVYDPNNPAGVGNNNPKGMDTEKSNASDPIDSILSSMGLDSSGLTDQEKSVKADDEAQVSFDRQARDEVDTILGGLESGTFPLTPSEQLQINTLRNSFSTALAEAQKTAANIAAGGRTMVAQNQLQMYSPQLAIGTIQNAIKAGQAKINEVNDRISKSVGDLTTALQDGDYKAATRLYTKIGDDISERTKEIDAMNKITSDTAQTILKSNLDQQTAFLKTQADILKSMQEGGATPEQMTAAGAATTIPDMIAAAGDSLQTATGTLGAYLYYSRQVKAAGGVPKDLIDFSQEYDKKPAAVGAGNAPGGFSFDESDPGVQKKLTDNGWSTYNADTQDLSRQLVEGNMAPSDLSKRSTGNTSYNDVITAADKYSMATLGKHFNVAVANQQYKYANQKTTQDTLNFLKSLVGTQTPEGGTSGGNLDELLSQSNNITRTSFPAINDVAAWTRLEAGDPSIAAFRVTAVEVADQVAKILQGGGGNSTSDAKLAQATAMFDTGFSKNQIQSIIASLKPLLANRAKTMIGDNPYLSQYADDFGFQQNLPGKSAATTQAQSDIDAQSAVDKASIGNPDVQHTVYTLLTTPDATLGRVLTYPEILQYLQATGKSQ
jgi:hypothetical protein